MKQTYIIALDTHCTFTEIGVMGPSGRMTRRWRCPTTIPDLRDRVVCVRGRREVVLEEGPLADWIARGLKPVVQAVTVCDPRRNHLIAKESDKDDPIDVEKLATLYRGGYVKAVHHAESLDRVLFKRRVGLYHHAVRQRVRVANRIMAELRQYGLFVREAAFANASKPQERAALLDRLPQHAIIREDLSALWRLYDATAGHVKRMRRRVVRLAKKEPQIVRFKALPGVKWIRASTFVAYVDTPWRFPSKQALCKYLGIGLERRHSGAGAEKVRVPFLVNRALKNVILGAAKAAIRQGNNPFAEQHERWIHEGLTPRIARRNVARSQAAVMWGMWKSGSVYCPEVVGVAAVDQPAVSSPRHR